MIPTAIMNFILKKERWARRNLNSGTGVPNAEGWTNLPYGPVKFGNHIDKGDKKVTDVEV